MKRRSIDGSASFDEAIRRAVRVQAQAKGFRFTQEPAGAAADEKGDKEQAS